MAIRQVYIGSVGPFLYDDTQFYPNTSIPIRGIRTNDDATPGAILFGLSQTDVGGAGTSVVLKGTIACVSAEVDALVGGLSAVAGSYVALSSGKSGAGSFLPLVFFTGGVERLRIAADGTITFSGAIATTEHVDIDADSKALRLGADQDATILYDGTDLQINPKAVGTGKMTVAGVVNTTESYQVDGTKVVGNQESAIPSLTDNSGGTANDTVQALTDPVDTPLTADILRDDLVANLIPELRNNYADIAAKINTILTTLRNHGLIAT
jgi:hypothetical protein